MGKVVSIFSCCFNGFLSFTNSRLENFLTAIANWGAGNVHSHLEGGMKYSHGHLIVPEDGEHYAYAQLYFRSGGRVLILKNHHEVITMLQHSHNVPEGPHYARRAFYPEAGDTLSVTNHDTCHTLHVDCSLLLWSVPDTVSFSQSRKSLEGNCTTISKTDRIISKSYAVM